MPSIWFWVGVILFLSGAIGRKGFFIFELLLLFFLCCLNAFMPNCTRIFLLLA